MAPSYETTKTFVVTIDNSGKLDEDSRESLLQIISLRRDREQESRNSIDQSVSWEGRNPVLVLVYGTNPENPSVLKALEALESDMGFYGILVARCDDSRHMSGNNLSAHFFLNRNFREQIKKYGKVVDR